MAADTTRRPKRAQETRPRMVRYGILLATVSHVLRDRGFQAKMITGAIGAVALAQLGRDNQARPVRRVAGWYSKLGISEEVTRVREALEEGLEESKEKLGLDSEPSGR